MISLEQIDYGYDIHKEKLFILLRKEKYYSIHYIQFMKVMISTDHYIVQNG